jgi:hypothetical protein
MLCLDDCFATTIITQLTEITQFIFGQPLRLTSVVRVGVAARDWPGASAAESISAAASVKVILTWIPPYGILMRI